MARMKDVRFAIKVNGIRSIKKATKAVSKLAKAISDCDEEAKKASASFRELAIIAEVSEGKNGDDD